MWPGCLPKLSVHNPDYFSLRGRLLLIDLDTIITGNIDHFVQYGGELATRMTFREPGQSGGDLIAFENGGEMSLNLWRKITTYHDELIKMTEGRERFVYRSRDWTPQPEFWSDLFPGEYVSYKRHIRPYNNVLPAGVRLVSCHGLNTNGPRPHHLLEQGIDWVKEYWTNGYKEVETERLKDMLLIELYAELHPDQSDSYIIDMHTELETRGWKYGCGNFVPIEANHE
jgi:hypothetical protein